MGGNLRVLRMIGAVSVGLAGFGVLTTPAAGAWGPAVAAWGTAPARPAAIGYVFGSNERPLGSTWSPIGCCPVIGRGLNDGGGAWAAGPRTSSALIDRLERRPAHGQGQRDRGDRT
jgi:hypothetical protein